MFSSKRSVLRRPPVFISFKTEGEEAAAQLKAALEAGGFSVWWQQSIQCGREWHSDIDSAILAAGCIVVLWSPASIVSPWVRHEASQAVARGIYTPVRLVPMAIGSPFDRLQATDLFGWSGDPNHPGLLRLLARANQLIPPPLPLHKRLGRYVRRNWLPLIIAIVVTAPIAMLVRLSLGLETQLAAQAAIAHSVQRTLDPLSDFEVTAYLTIDPNTPGVAEYLARLRNFFHLSGATTLPPGTEMPHGATVVRSRADGQSKPSHSTSTPSFGRRTRRPAGSVLSVGMLRFTLSCRARPQPTVANPTWNSTLVRMIRTARKAEDHETQDLLTGTFRTTRWSFISPILPVKKNWRSNGAIAAFPDLQSAIITVEIASTSYSSVSDRAAVAGIDASRQKLALSTIFVGVGERKSDASGVCNAGQDGS